MKIFYSMAVMERIQFRFPRTKNKRKRAKWTQREQNIRYVPRMFMANGVLFAHPSFRREIEQRMAAIASEIESQLRGKW